MSGVFAHAKLNLALLVGPIRLDGKHEVASVLQAIDLHDEVELEPAEEPEAVEGYSEDTLVRAALQALAEAAGVVAEWRIRIEKRIPVTAGLGGGSSDAAAALKLANAHLSEPLPLERLHEIGAQLGADVPFFLYDHPQLATGDGSELSPLDLPDDYVVLVLLPAGEEKESTAAVYGEFDERGGADGFDARRAGLLEALLRVERSTDLASLPPNDLASSPVAKELARLGAFRAEVTGAGPAVYGLFEQEPDALRAASSLRRVGPSWIARPLPSARPPGR